MKEGKPDECHKESSRIHARFELLRYFDTVIFWSVGVEIRRETSQNRGWLVRANL